MDRHRTAARPGQGSRGIAIRRAAWCAVAGLCAWGLAARAADLVGSAAFGDWRADRPGLSRRITPADLPPPYATGSAVAVARIAAPPKQPALALPPGFSVTLFARHLAGPRALKVAPNGDVFVAESRAGRVVVLRSAGAAAETATFAAGLDSPFGIAFYPPGPAPQFVYVGTPQAIVRFPYRVGDLRARGPGRTVVPRLAESGAGHWTRDIAFTPDGKRMFVSVGSATNDGETTARWSAPRIAEWRRSHAAGEAWGEDAGRAVVLEFDPEGGGRRVFATGLRNCIGLAVDARSGAPWCTVNERDGLGDDLPPDYVTRVRQGAFYGWPWFYLGGHEDPRHRGERPDLAGEVALPDVLIQAHSAPMQMCFYDGDMFPAAYRGNVFVALHGSWNRHRRTGYKVVRIPVRDGVPGGEYEDFMTGFVTAEDGVWGRPVGVAVAADGALLIGEDGNGTIWRISYDGRGSRP